MKKLSKTIAACDPDELPTLTERMPPEASRARIRKKVREKLDAKPAPTLRIIKALRPIAAAFTVILGIVLTIALIPIARNFIANAALPEFTPGTDTIDTPPIEFPENDSRLKLTEIAEDGTNYYFRFAFTSETPIDAAALICRNVVFQNATTGYEISSYSWDIDDAAYVRNALLAGDVFCGVPSGTEVGFQFKAHKGRVKDGDILSLTIDGLVAADLPEEVPVITPLADSLSLTFTAGEAIFEDPNAITNAIGTTEGPITVIGTREDKSLTYFRFRVELDQPLAGQFILAGDSRITNAEGGMVNYTYNPRELTEQSIGASIMAGDIMAVCEVGSDFIEFEHSVATSRLAKGEVLTLTVTDLICVETEDAVEMTIHPLFDTISVTFAY